MPVSTAQALAKAKAYVDTLSKIPRSQHNVVPSGTYGQDYNVLRNLAMECLPNLDERLLGKFITVHALPDGREVSDASYIEIETYARQIMEQLAEAVAPTMQSDRTLAPANQSAPASKTYDLQAIRKEHNQAYAPWSAEDDEYLRSRFLQGATIDELVSEFGRQPGGIRSRLQKLGLNLPP